MVEFISYNGEYPNLCSGLLVIKVNGKLYELRHCLYSSGQCFFDDDYNEVVTEGDWFPQGLKDGYCVLGIEVI